MSRGVNKVMILGRLGNDPDVRYAADGKAVTTISVATSESWKDRNTGQQQERTEWHRIVFFGRLAEIAGQYLRKGSQVYVEGSLRTNKYTDKNGIERYSTDINANELQMLGGGNQQQAPSQNQGYNQQQAPSQNQGYNQQQAPGQNQGFNQPNNNPALSDFDNIDEDVPF